LNCDFTKELSDGFIEAADGVGMGVTLRHKGRLIRAIEDTQTAGLEFMDGGAMEDGTRTFCAFKADFGTIQPQAEEKIELMPNPKTGGAPIKLRIQNPDTKQIDPTVRLICRPETK
jgi:hypothetical protein